MSPEVEHERSKHKQKKPRENSHQHRLKKGETGQPSKTRHKRPKSRDDNDQVEFDPHKRIKQEPESDISPPHRRSQHHDSDSPPPSHRRHHLGNHRRIKKEPDRDRRQQRLEREHNNERRLQARQERENNNQPSGGPGNWGDASRNKKPPEKEKPNFEVSGKLTEDTNMYRGVVIKYNEPPEARKPKRRWRLYPFKGEESLPVLYIHRQSAYLIGRDRRVADLPVDHPSCSKQHAALQYRLVNYMRDDGTTGRRVRLYIIDLGSANGTFLNNQQIEPQKYVELREKDVLKFGFSSREYVLLHEGVEVSGLGDDEDM